MQLLRNRVLVKLVNDEIISSGGIIIPKTVTHFVGSVKAQVLLLGQKSLYGEWWMKVGDFVKLDMPEYAYRKYTEVEYKGETCYIVNEDDINCVI